MTTPFNARSSISRDRPQRVQPGHSFFRRDVAEHSGLLVVVSAHEDIRPLFCSEASPETGFFSILLN